MIMKGNEMFWLSEELLVWLVCCPLPLLLLLLLPARPERLKLRGDSMVPQAPSTCTHTKDQLLSAWILQKYVMGCLLSGLHIMHIVASMSWVGVFC